MLLDCIKSFEHNTLVSCILSKYLSCEPENILQCLVRDDKDNTTIYGLLEYWAEINYTDSLNVLDFIELSLNEVADFVFISTSPPDIGGAQGSTANTILKLNKNIIIPLEWLLD